VGNTGRAAGPSTPANFRSEFASRVGKQPVHGPGFQTPVRPPPMNAPRTSPVAISHTPPLAATGQREAYGGYALREEFREQGHLAYTSPRAFPGPPQEYISQSHAPLHFTPSKSHPPPRNQDPFTIPHPNRSYPFTPPSQRFFPAPVEALERPPASRHLAPPARAVTSAAVSARPSSSVIRLERGRLERPGPFSYWARREGERPGSRQFVAGLTAHGKTR
jgi:hypothetical protein